MKHADLQDTPTWRRRANAEILVLDWMQVDRQVITSSTANGCVQSIDRIAFSPARSPIFRAQRTMAYLSGRFSHGRGTASGRVRSAGIVAHGCRSVTGPRGLADGKGRRLDVRATNGRQLTGLKGHSPTRLPSTTGRFSRISDSLGSLRAERRAQTALFEKFLQRVHEIKERKTARLAELLRANIPFDGARCLGRKIVAVSAPVRKLFAVIEKQVVGTFSDALLRARYDFTGRVGGALQQVARLISINRATVRKCRKGRFFDPPRLVMNDFVAACVDPVMGVT
jgi:hypothetical protein